jgi:alpha-1,3-rhamnosyl/mannosyltransferase
MRVLLNGLTALKPRTGIGQYSVHLATELKSLLPSGEFAVYPPEPWKTMAARILSRSGSRQSSGEPRKSGDLRSIRRALKQGARTLASLHFARYCRTYGAKLYHEPNYLPFAADVPTVITVHDLSVLLHSEWHPADRVHEHTRHLERATAKAAHVITDTEQVKREVIAELGVAASKVTAIHLGVGPEFRPVAGTEMATWRQQLDLPSSYFLCVGTIEPRKNLLTAMKAFAALPASLREQSPLLLVGPWGWRADSEFEFYDRVGRDAGIRHLGYVPDAAMPALYSGAAALLYPSHYEGFGLPPLEAAACGCAAICSFGTAAVREVMGSAATYCGTDDIEGWREAMRKKNGERAATSLRGHARPFTWQHTAVQTLGLYEQVLGHESTSRSLRVAA